MKEGGCLFVGVKVKYGEEGVILRDESEKMEILVEKTTNEMNIASDKVNQVIKEGLKEGLKETMKEGGKEEKEWKEWRQEVDGFRYRTRRKLRREVCSSLRGVCNKDND